MQDAAEYEDFAQTVMITESAPIAQPAATLMPAATATPTDEESLKALPVLQEDATVDGPLSETSNPTETLTGIDLVACLSQNADFIAWLRIPGTAVDYPVVRSDDTAYYLHHLFTGKSSSLGCLFSLLDTDYETPGRNIAVYGHHLRTGDAMFSSLANYKKRTWLDEHLTIQMDTLYGSRTYRIFAAANYSVGQWDPSVADFDSDREFSRFLSEIQSHALYDTGVQVGKEDHILTLITCDRSYDGASGRLAVFAVQE